MLPTHKTLYRQHKCDLAMSARPPKPPPPQPPSPQAPYLMMSLLMSLNSFQSSSRVSMSRYSGSNLGPPGMAMLRLLAVTKEAESNR